ncbi:transposase [Amycolatopsis acidiphila]|uniref:transposase n=1 Tax=Amycolatopsis acidiphila TaxID=715473 RepID=UPI001E46806A|nr:transposase [Amycolatopsis acidiphila]UIJ63767.1 transposase [Amycolatopsis acidiphila]
MRPPRHRPRSRRRGQHRRQQTRQRRFEFGLPEPGVRTTWFIGLSAATQRWGTIEVPPLSRRAPIHGPIGPEGARQWQHRRSTPDELPARAVRLYRDCDPKPVIRKLAEQLGVHHEALRNWIRQDEADRGERGDRPTSEMAEENKQLRKRVAELERINANLRDASACFASEIGQTRR